MADEIEPAPVLARELTDEEQLYAKARVEALRAGQIVPEPPMGVRLTKRLVPRLSDVLLEEMRKRMVAGATAERSMASLGVPRRVFTQWMAWGEAGMGELYVRLHETAERADAQFEVDRLARVATGKMGWQSSAWLLERKYSDRYALKTKQEITGANGGPVLIGPGKALLPPEEDDDD